VGLAEFLRSEVQMNLILLTGNECKVCHDVEEAFKKKYADELKSGEADICNLDEDEQAQQFWFENELPLAPVVVVVSDKMKLISVLDPSDLTKEAKPAETSADKAPAGRAGI
jgi:hypothetical protein